MNQKITDFDVLDSAGQSISMAQFSDSVLLVVNTASACRFTPQYAQLQELHEQYADKGLKIIAFPCNQFGAQEKGNATEIAEFCDLNFAVKFPVMGKIEVNGGNAHPLWQWLKSQATGILGTQRIKWNFTKFLVARDGTTVKRFAPMTEPREMRALIEQFLVSHKGN
ncbi:MAG: glutathione peroxidase [Formosimonas sp.]